jgi:hypothetical protein
MTTFFDERPVREKSLPLGGVHDSEAASASVGARPSAPIVAKSTPAVEPAPTA